MKSNQKKKVNVGRAIEEVRQKKADVGRAIEEVRQKKLSPHMLRVTMFTLCTLALTGAAVALLTRESEYLWKVQELNLHLDTPLFFKQQMVVAGGLLTWLGTWFTEFLYHPWLGVLMLCAMWALLMWLVKRTFKVPSKWGAVVLIPVALLLIADVSVGYWVYYLKLRGFFFAATIGSIVACTAVWIFRCLPSGPFIRPAYVVLSTALLYPFIGFYGLMAAIVMGTLAWQLKEKKESHRFINTAMAGVSAVVVPLVFYRLVFYQTAESNIYWTGLPLFRINEQYQSYYIPYYLLAAFFVAMALCYRPEWQKAPQQRRSGWFWMGGQIAFALMLLFAVGCSWYTDHNFHKELRMQRCMEQEDWQGMLSEAAQLDDEPTRAIVMMKNLALSRLGRQGDEMYHYRTGAKASNTPIPVHMTQIVGRAIYYNYGQLNFCYRWCLEDGVEMGWRAEYLRYLTRCSLLNGEWQVARKYIGILKHTRYHRQWAEEQERFIDNEEALRADAAYGPIFHMMGYDDQLASDNALVEYYLMKNIAWMNSDDPIMQEQILLAALWMKDIQMFWPRFFQYASMHPGKHMPRHYQEAAYLYGHLEHNVDISRMPFDKEVVDSYNEFMALAQRCQGMSEEKMRDVFYPRFGKTFYYEYFLVRGQKLY